MSPLTCSLLCVSRFFLRCLFHLFIIHFNCLFLWLKCQFHTFFFLFCPFLLNHDFNLFFSWFFLLVGVQWHFVWFVASLVCIIGLGDLAETFFVGGPCLHSFGFAIILHRFHLFHSLFKMHQCLRSRASFRLNNIGFWIITKGCLLFRLSSFRYLGFTKHQIYSRRSPSLLGYSVIWLYLWNWQFNPSSRRSRCAHGRVHSIL